jgi:hypothetical protein
VGASFCYLFVVGEIKRFELETPGADTPASISKD